MRLLLKHGFWCLSWNFWYVVEKFNLFRQIIMSICFHSNNPLFFFPFLSIFEDVPCEVMCLFVSEICSILQKTCSAKRGLSIFSHFNFSRRSSFSRRSLFCQSFIWIMVLLARRSHVTIIINLSNIKLYFFFWSLFLFPYFFWHISWNLNLYNLSILRFITSLSLFLPQNSYIQNWSLLFIVFRAYFYPSFSHFSVIFPALFLWAP